MNHEISSNSFHQYLEAETNTWPGKVRPAAQRQPGLEVYHTNAFSAIMQWHYHSSSANHCTTKMRGTMLKDNQPLSGSQVWRSNLLDFRRNFGRNFDELIHIACACTSARAMAFVIFLLEPCARRQVRTVRLKLFPMFCIHLRMIVLVFACFVVLQSDDHYHSGLMPSADGCYGC